MGMQLKITRSTKLLGAMFNDRNDMSQEIASRTLTIKEATGPMRRTLFARKAISQKAKVHYLEAFGYSKLFFNAGTWTISKATDHGRLNTAYVSAARQAIGITHREMKAKSITNIDVITKAEVPTLEVRLRQLRLRQLGRIITQCPPELEALADDNIAHEGAWTVQLNTDIKAASQYIEQKGTATKITTIHEWIAATKEGPQTTKSIITSSTKRAKAWTQDEARKARWRANLQATCIAAGLPSPTPTTTSTNNTSQEYMCYQCGMILGNKAAHTKHVNSYHDPDDNIANVATGTTCQICLKDYGTPNRLIKHLKASKLCAASWVNTTGRPTEDEVKANKILIKKVRRTNKHNGLPEDYAEIPVVQHCGPAIGPKVVNADGFAAPVPATVPEKKDEARGEESPESEAGCPDEQNKPHVIIIFSDRHDFIASRRRTLQEAVNQSGKAIEVRTFAAKEEEGGYNKDTLKLISEKEVALTIIDANVDTTSFEENIRNLNHPWGRRDTKEVVAERLRNSNQALQTALLLAYRSLASKIPCIIYDMNVRKYKIEEFETFRTMPGVFDQGATSTIHIKEEHRDLQPDDIITKEIIDVCGSYHQARYWHYFEHEDPDRTIIVPSDGRDLQQRRTSDDIPRAEDPHQSCMPQREAPKGGYSSPRPHSAVGAEGGGEG